MKCPQCGEDDINGPFCCGYEPKGKKKVMTPTPQKFVDSKPWEDKDGATNVDGFLKAYADDDNTFWRMESGHAMNVIDELIERLKTSHDEGVRDGLEEAISACEKLRDECLKEGGSGDHESMCMIAIRQRSSK